MDRASLSPPQADSTKSIHHRVDILFGLPGESFLLQEGNVLIGRSAAVGIQLRHLSVFPEHCRLILRSMRCWIEDTGGASTLVNGTRIRTRLELASGDVIQVGSVSLRYRACSEPIESAMPSKVGRGQAMMTVGGVESDEIPMQPGTISIGRDPACTVILQGMEVVPRHATIVVKPTGATMIAGEDNGECRVNGLHFDEHELAFGDQLQVGPYLFQYKGQSMRLISTETGAALQARDLTVISSGRKILDHVSLSITQNQLIGIIGPIGAGKSTFLRALNGLRPADGGSVFINGVDLYRNFATLGREFGWVPQEIIIHRELTVLQALTFASRLRLPAGTPKVEMRKAVRRSMERLGLTRHADTRIRSLSGGETKTVSVAVELLSRPHVMILDEPTSGLDPAAEFRMMELLRQLADSGCTVVCSTHNMTNVYLFDKLAVLSDAMLVFSGRPEQVRDFFGARDLPGIFLRLGERPSVEWRESYETGEFSAGASSQFPPVPSDPPREKRGAQIPLLLERQWAIFVSDPRNLLITLGQPLVIGFLLVWAVSGTSDDGALKLFITYIATLWFGCSNGAQAIIGELPIYKRERMVGLGRQSYVFSKALFTILLTLAQALMLFAVEFFLGGGIDGATDCQMAGITAMAAVSSCIGLLISSASRSTMQAVLIVPLVIIPQIILSGYTVPVSSMSDAVKILASATPTFQLQRIMDASLLWGRSIDSALLEQHMLPFRNLNSFLHLSIGDRFASLGPVRSSLLVELLWVIAAYLVTLFILRAKERE